MKFPPSLRQWHVYPSSKVSMCMPQPKCLSFNIFQSDQDWTELAMATFDCTFIHACTAKVAPMKSRIWLSNMMHTSRQEFLSRFYKIKTYQGSTMLQEAAVSPVLQLEVTTHTLQFLI